MLAILENLSFLSASALWWLWLIPFIVLLYFLKLKREEIVFPSTLLWRKVVEDMRVNSPFQRLKNNILLLLQILLLLLLILALARLSTKSKTIRGRDVVLLFDVSTSMQATDEDGNSRIDAAKELVLEMIDGIADEDRMMIISFSDKARIEQIFTRMKWKLTQTVEKLEPHDTATNLEEALLIARTMLQKVATPAIYVVTDGVIPNLPKLLQDPKGDAVEPQFVIVGKKRENVGILAFDVRPDPGKKTYQAFVRLQNFGSKTIEGLLQIFVNGEPIDEDIRLIRLAQANTDPGSDKAGYTDGVLFTDLVLQQGVLEVRFTVQEGEDYLALDNRAWYVVPPLKETRLCLVTEGNFFLRKVLLPHDHKLTVMTPEQYEAVQPPADYDLLVFDNYTPKKALPPGGYLFFNCLPPGQVIRAVGEIGEKGRRLPIIDQKDVHPAMRFIDLRRIGIAKAMQLKWPEDTEPLLEAETQAVIGALHRQNQYYVVVGFDVFQTDWPLKLSFPIFVANTLRWLQNIRNKQNIRTGELVYYRSPEAGEAVLTSPNGVEQKRETKKGEDVTFSGTEKAGLYSIAVGSGVTEMVAANLLSEQESDIAPRQQIEVKGKNVASRELQPMDYEWWRHLVWIGFFVLLVEWYVFHRRSLFAWWPGRK